MNGRSDGGDDRGRIAEGTAKDVESSLRGSTSPTGVGEETNQAMLQLRQGEAVNEYSATLMQENHAPSYNSYVCAIKMHTADWIFPNMKFMTKGHNVCAQETILRMAVTELLDVEKKDEVRVWKELRPEVMECLRKRRNAVTAAMKKVAYGKKCKNLRVSGLLGNW